MSTKFKVLILDDDQSFADSLSKSLQTYNYDLIVCTSSFDAEDKLQTFCPDLLIVDLFMPSGNGSDWVSSLLKQGDFKVPVVYVSGVFTDVEFQNSLLHHPLILKVFSKPFEVASLLQVLEQCQKNKESASKESFQISELSCVEQALIGSSYLDQQFINNLKKPMKFIANNLPEYLTCFFKIKATGVLKIKKDTQEIGIRYSKGNVTFINMDDRDTSFGILLAKFTQLSYKEIEKYCIEAKEAKQSIGSFLLKHSLVKEVEIFKVINLQIALRFLKLFDDKEVSCEWFEQEKSIQTEVGFFSIEGWHRILIRFSNNLTDEYLHLFLKKFNSYYLALRKESFPKSISNVELLDNFAKIKTELSSSYIQFKNLKLIKESQKLKTIYLFLLLDILAFSDSKQLSKKELLVIHNENKSSNYFEVLNIDLNSTESNIKQAYRKLSKKFHPDNCSFLASSEEKELYEEIFKSISQAYSTLSKEGQRVSYQSLLEQETFEEQFKGQLLENEIVSQLQSKNLSNILEKIKSPFISYAKKQVFLLWNLIVVYREEATAVKKQVIKKKMKVYMKNIPDSILQFNHFVYLVKALYYEVEENLEEAQYYFSKIQNIESMDIVDNLQNIEVLLLQKRKRNIKKRDVKFGVILSVLVISILSYKLKTNQTDFLMDKIENNMQVKTVTKEKKKKRSLSSVDKKIQVAAYFSDLKGFHVEVAESNKRYSLISLKNYLLISKKGNKNKLNILIYKQLLPAAELVTEKNFLKKQKRLKGLDKFLQSKAILKKQSSTIWSGFLTGSEKKNLLVQYIKDHRSFIYFIGNPKNIIELKADILKGLSQL